MIATGTGKSTSAMIFLLIVSAGMFAKFLALSGLAEVLVGSVTRVGLSPLMFVILSAAIYVVLGLFLDSISMLSLTLPVIYPVLNALKIDPIYFAMVAIIAIHVGVITPPVGLNVYAVKGVAEADVRLEDIFAGVLPFFVMMIITLLIFVFIPSLSTWLPNLMFD